MGGRMYPPSPLLILITLLANRSPRVPTMCWGSKSRVWAQVPYVGESSLPGAAVYHTCLPALSFPLSLAFTQPSPA